MNDLTPQANALPAEGCRPLDRYRNAHGERAETQVSLLVAPVDLATLEQRQTETFTFNYRSMHLLSNQPVDALVTQNAF